MDSPSCSRRLDSICTLLRVTLTLTCQITGQFKGESEACSGCCATWRRIADCWILFLLLFVVGIIIVRGDHLRGQLPFLDNTGKGADSLKSR